MKRTRAFTLIEILVVVGIVAILAALIFPAVARSKRRAVETTCISNLRQIGVANGLYMVDYNDLMPVDVPVIWDYNKEFVDLLEPYGTKLELYECKSRSDGYPRPHIDVKSRNAIVFTRGNDFRIVWPVLLGTNFVFAYCHWHGPDGVTWPGGKGFIQAVRVSGEAQRIPAAQIVVHEDDWGGFGPDVNPNYYRWYQFPGETFPPGLVQVP